MTPETEALIARVRELENRIRAYGINESDMLDLADLAPQLATLTETEAARADAAEKERDALRNQIRATLAQLNLEESK